MTPFYAEDLAHIHHTGFGAFAREAAPGLLAMLRRSGVTQGLVVDLGCGTGLWAQSLVEAGYEVLGVDCAPAMLRLARETAPAARYVLSSLYDVEIPPCGAVTAIGEGLTYIGAQDPQEALPGLFSRVHQALSPGGVLIFDAILRSSGEPMRYRSSREGSDWRVEAEVVEEPDQCLLTRQITTIRSIDGIDRRSEEEHSVRTFPSGQLEQMLLSSGFRFEAHQCYGAMPLLPQRVAFLAYKDLRPDMQRRSPSLPSDSRGARG